MKSIYCSSKEETITYTDKQGNVKTKTYEPKDWQINRYIDNGTAEGIMQRANEELLMLRGEVVGQENSYGMDWATYFEYSRFFYGEDKESKKSIRDMFIRDVKQALSQVGNLCEVNNVVFNPNHNNGKIIQCFIVATYNNTDNKPELLSFEFVNG